MKFEYYVLYFGGTIEWACVTEWASGITETIFHLSESARAGLNLSVSHE